MTQPVAFTANSRQQHYKMSIAFLSGEVNEPEPMDAEMTDKPSDPAPAQAELILQMPRYQPEKSPWTPITLPSLRLDCSPYSNGPYSAPQLPHIGSLSSINSYCSANSANIWGSSVASSPSSSTTTTTSSSFLSINNSAVKCQDSLRDIESTSPATSYHSSNSFTSINTPLAAHAHARQEHQLQPSHSAMVAKPLARVPRPARPSYSEEQKFFIMYYRVVKGLSWPEIADKFGAFFNLRTKDGLTSVYYRVRKDWGMEEVLKTGRDGYLGDRGKIESRAAHFPTEFLTNLGYFE